MLASLTIAAGTGLGAAILAGYHCYAPTSQLYGRAFCGTPGCGKNLALTFDDGPNDPHTLNLLDVLARHEVKATFFLIGRFVAQRPDIARQIVAAGHETGNHTFTHRNLLFATRQQVRKEVQDCSRALLDAGCTPTKLFRAPFGARRPATLRVVRELGYEPIQWSVSSYDWKERTASAVERQVARRVRGGDVVLLHDGSFQNMGVDFSHSVSATDLIIRGYKNEGFAFVRLGEWLSSVQRER